MYIYACTQDGTSPVDICAKESTFLIGSLAKISPRHHSYKCLAIFWISSAFSTGHQDSFRISVPRYFLRYPGPLKATWEAFPAAHLSPTSIQTSCGLPKPASLTSWFPLTSRLHPVWLEGNSLGTCGTLGTSCPLLDFLTIFSKCIITCRARQPTLTAETLRREGQKNCEFKANLS